MLILQRDTQLRSELQKHFVVSQVLISSILQVKMGAIFWGEPALLDRHSAWRRNTFGSASVYCPDNLIEMWNNALASHIYRINFVLSVFVAFFRIETPEVCAESLRFETGSLLGSDNDTWQAPSTCYKLFLKELNQARNSLQTRTRGIRCNTSALLQRGCIIA